ncbi:MAG: potassium/proton antiporter [Candidatus Azobacteroides sp.]|nr:potassium/proton antiporter [Candidatus Azobacteroides sp.]
MRSLTAENLLLIGSILLFISLLAGKTSYKVGIPTLLLFLVIGMLAGSDGVGIHFNNPKAAQFIGVIALNIILFSGGMDTKYAEIKPIIIPGFILSIVGVLLTAFFTGCFIYWITNDWIVSITFSFVESLLLASVMSSTDSASVFSLLRSKGLSLKENLRPLLEFESGSNDPMAYMLTISFIAVIQNPTNSLGHMVLFFFMQLFIGSLIGFVLGKLSVRLINKINLDNDSLYSVLLLTCMFFIFSFTDFIKGNGYLAVYLAGLVMGNSKFIHKRSVVKFFDGLTWLVQIVMFLTLGLLVNPSELLPISGVALLIGIFMILVGRPLSVFLSLLPIRHISLKARIYVSWVGLRGAVPIIFATYPWIANISQAKMIFNIVFFITILSLIVQGSSLSWMAKFLGLSKETREETKLTEFDVEFSDEIKSAMSELVVKNVHLKNGHKIMNMDLPEKTLVVMVKRNNHYFIPKGNTELNEGDILLLISDDEAALRETYKQMGEKVQE